MLVGQVGGQDVEVGWVWVVLTPRGRYRANALGTAWPTKRHGGWCRGSVWAAVYVWFEVVGGRDAEIGQEWVVVTPRGRYRANALGTDWPSKMHGGWCRGSVCADVNV